MNLVHRPAGANGFTAAVTRPASSPRERLASFRSPLELAVFGVQVGIVVAVVVIGAAVEDEHVAVEQFLDLERSAAVNVGAVGCCARTIENTPTPASTHTTARRNVRHVTSKPLVVTITPPQDAGFVLAASTP